MIDFSLTQNEIDTISELVNKYSGHGGTTANESMCLYSMSKHVVDKKCDILETGTWVGVSATALALPLIGKSTATVFTIDVNPSIQEGLMEEYKVGSIIKSIKSSSLDYEWSNKLSMIFLDSDHSYEHVRKEIEKYVPYLITGGIIAGHDYATIPEVRKAFDELFSCGNFKFSTCGQTIDKINGNIVYGIKT